jgi:orotate phosphoribosyltransferase
VKAFFVRKEAKEHALGRQIEGPVLTEADRCLIVEDVITTGGSTVRAIEAVRAAGHEICGVMAICDRLAGGREPIERAAQAPFLALTTIDDVYAERPDR